MAQVTRAEYQNVKNTVNNQYTADSLQNYQNAYNDYKAQGMSTKDAVAKAQGLLVAKGTTAPSNSGTTTGTTTYSGTTGTTQSTTPTARQTTTVNQTEKPVSTTNEIKQQGQLKPLSQDYYNQTSSEAQDKIRYNLNSYRQSNPELFTDYESFKKNFSYDARDEVQKQTLDNWYKGYEKGLQLSSVPVNDLYNQYNSGQISSSDLEVLRNYNPTKYAELQNQINKGSIIQAYDDNKDTTGTSIQDMAYESAMQMFKQFMSGDSSSGASQYFQDYKNNLNSPEMLELSDKTTEIDEQRDNILDQISTMTKDVEKEYEGTGATKSKINAIVADRTYDLQQQLRTLDNEYKKYATQYNNRLQQYQNEFQLQLQEYQVNMQARQQQMSELGFAMDLMSFETPEQQQQRQWDYWVAQQEYTNGNINSKDYQTRYKAALSSVQNLLSQYEGIPMVRSAEQMAQDVLKAIDNGSDLGTELTKINQLIQQKPEYKQLYNATYGTGTSSSSLIQDTIKIGDTEWVKYNGQRLTADEFNSMLSNGTLGSGTGKAKAYKLVDENLLQNNFIGVSGEKNLGRFLMQPENLNGKKGGQCGKFVNDYLQYIGMTGSANRYYDDSLETKLNSVNTYTPKVGTIAVFDYGHKSSDGINHGHVGIVTKIYSDGSFDMRDSNGDLSKPKTIRTVHVTDSKGLKGFFDPSQPPLNGGTTTTNTKSTDAFTTAGNNIALNLGSVSATNTFNEQLQRYLDDGNFTSAFEYITTQARNKADSDTRQAINSAESAMSALVSIQQGLDAFYNAGGDTNIFAGTAEQVANKIGETTNPELKKLATQINVAIQKYRQAISGAAFSEQEAAEYASIFPSTKNDKELNTALIDGTLQTMLQNLNSSYAQILGTSTYTDLLQAYQDSTGDIYDYYGNKQTLTKYLKDNGYMSTDKTNNAKTTGGKTFIKNGSKNTNTTSSTTSSGILKKAKVVEPNMSQYQSSTTSDLGNGLLRRTVNGVTQYSYDGGATWH